MAEEERMGEPQHHHRGFEPEPAGSVRFQHSTPIFRVEAMGISIEYYVKQLGFQLAWDWGDPPTFACVKRGDVSLFLSERNQGQREPGSSSTWMMSIIFTMSTKPAAQESFSPRQTTPGAGEK